MNAENRDTGGVLTAEAIQSFREEVRSQRKVALSSEPERIICPEWFLNHPFEGAELVDTVFLAISDGTVMGVYHSELQACVHGDEVQEWEVR